VDAQFLHLGPPPVSYTTAEDHRWCDYISDLVLSRLNVEPAELQRIFVDRGVFQVLLGLLPPQHQRESECENECYTFCQHCLYLPLTRL